MSVVSPDMGRDGWTFDTAAGSTGDPVNGKSKLSEIYLLAAPRYTGRVSVPVLWDKERRTIVNNESSEIIRMLNSAFDAYTNVRTDYYPAHSARRDRPAQRSDLSERQQRRLSRRLRHRRSRPMSRPSATCSTRSTRWSRSCRVSAISPASQFTEADWRFFPTLIRFDAVYYAHFKCNWRHIYEYPNLSNYVRDLYQVPGIAETVSLEQIKRHYYWSQRQVNPTGIVPLGPQLDFAAPHDRGRFARQE